MIKPYIVLNIIILLMASGGCSKPEQSLSGRPAPTPGMPTYHIQAQLSEDTLRLFGKITANPDQKSAIAARIAGWITKVLIPNDYSLITPGTPLLQIYSPQLAALQREALFLYQKDPQYIGEALEKLDLSGMTPAQITRLLERQKIIDTLTLYAEQQGYLSNDTLSFPREGQYVSKDALLFMLYQPRQSIAVLQAPPDIAPTLHRGAALTIIIGDKTIKSRIARIEPFVSETTPFVPVKVYLNAPYPIGTLISAVLIQKTTAYFIPQSAAIYLGHRYAVVKKEANSFRTVFIPFTPPKNNQIKAPSFMKDWDIVLSPHFLTDADELFTPSEILK